MKNTASKEEIIEEIQRLEIALSKFKAEKGYENLGMLHKLAVLHNKL